MVPPKEGVSRQSPRAAFTVTPPVQSPVMVAAFARAAQQARAIDATSGAPQTEPATAVSDSREVPVATQPDLSTAETPEEPPAQRSSSVPEPTAAPPSFQDTPLVKPMADNVDAVVTPSETAVGYPGNVHRIEMKDEMQQANPAAAFGRTDPMIYPAETAQAAPKASTDDGDDVGEMFPPTYIPAAPQMLHAPPRKGNNALFQLLAANTGDTLTVWF